MNKLLLFLLLLPFGVSAQLIQKNTTYGMAFNRTGADTLFYLPVDTFTVPTVYRTYNFMARKATTLYIWNTSTFAWQAVSSGGGAAGWELTGNSGTTAGTNFIGTTDSVSLVMKVNGVWHGFFDINKKNIGFGYSTLQSVTSLGIGNTGLGSYSLKAVTSGDYNVANGYNAGAAITTGNRNIAIGAFAYDTSATNFDMVAIGYQAMQKGGASGTIAIGTGALKNNSGGNTAIAIGYESMNASVQAGYSVGIGYQALYADTSKYPNIAIGYRALYTNKEYGYNTAVGYMSQTISNAAYNTSFGFQTLLVNTTGEQNTAFGANALYSNTTGIKNNAQGVGALENTTIGSYNTGVGHDVLLQNTEGNYNVGIGWLGWSQNRTGNYNVGIGASSGRSITNGTGNTFIGYQAGYGAGQEDTVNNCIALGYDALTTGSNQFVISDSITSYKLPNIPYSGSSTDSMMVWNTSSKQLGMRAIPSGGGSSGLTVGTTTVGSANSRAILYSNTGILKDSSIFVFNPGGELQVGSASDAGNYRLQVTGKTYGTDTAFFTSHGRIAGIDIGVYGGSMGIQNNYANTSRPDLYFRTFNGSSTNGNVYFESGSFKMQMMANDASKNQLQVVYGGNTGYFNVGSHTSIYSSSGQELRLGSGGTENQVTIASGRVGINATSPAASAQLEVASTTKGFLPPRMTATQAEAISSPAEGLLIYSTNGTGATITSKGWWGYDGSTWVKLN